jgi:hypothetical protein
MGEEGGEKFPVEKLAKDDSLLEIKYDTERKNILCFSFFRK